MAMVRIGLFLVCIGLAGVYLLKMEGRSVNNRLVCQYQADDLSLILQNHLSKFRTLLPETFPTERFKILSTEVTNAVQISKREVNCDSALQADFKMSSIYELRLALSPIYPSSSRTLAAIAHNLGEERRFIYLFKKLKNEFLKENERFENFLEDCNKIRSFADQISLLKGHLKIEKRARKPSSSAKLQTIEFSMNKNISKQINFARKQLSENEKLFHYKWKIYFNYDFGKALCRY